MGVQQAGVLAAVLPGLVLLAACGGGPASPGGTHAGWEKGKLLAFSACIRAQGVPGFPDPQPAGGYARRALNAIGMTSPQFQAAEKPAARWRSPAGSSTPRAELGTHADQEIAESLRKHGVPDMPLPNAQGQMVFAAAGPSPGQPQFQAAHRHCAYLNP